MKTKNIANSITGCRIVFGVAVLFFEPFSAAFYALYTAAGLTDMIDGTVARKTNSVSEFGEKFDTIADFVFVAACLIKLLPILDIPLWLWMWIAVIALIKMFFGIKKLLIAKEYQV